MDEDMEDRDIPSPPAPDDSFSNRSPDGVFGILSSISALLAAGHGQQTCAVHDDCGDESCPGRNRVYEAVQCPLTKALVVQDQSHWVADPSVICRDAAWMAEQGFDDFKYDTLPLSRAMIRLLHIKPATFSTDVIECEMITVSLDEALEFNAMSYYWGEPIFDRHILCNGNRLAVTRSLENALKGYRRERDDFSQRQLWADAICIDQSNKPELNAQILLMRNIYGKATAVFVDLGNIDSTWALGIDVMKKLSMAYRLARDDKTLSPTDIFERSGLPSGASEPWTYYMDLYSAPWFRRTWILQEIALARDAQVRLGRFKFPWSTLEESFNFFTRCKMHTLFSSKASSPRVMHGLLNVFSLLDLCDLAKKPKEDPNDLIFVLDATRDFLVSNPRDKVIGILGLIADGATNANMSFIADYTLPLEQVYHRLAVHLVRTGMVMATLPHAGLQRRGAARNLSLPSWAPDWTAQSREFGPRPLSLFRPAPYSAATSADFKVSVALKGDQLAPGILSIMGSWIDSIGFISDGHPLLTDTPTRVDTFLWWHDSVLKCLHEASSSLKIAHIDTEDAFARTLLVDDLYTGQNKVSRRSMSITDPAGCHAHVIRGLEPARKGLPSLADVGYGETAESTFAQQILAASPGRSFAVTAGGLMCLVPAAAKVGDGVVIFFGAETPYVIRPISPQGMGQQVTLIRAELLGDSYVHEMMEGQALNYGLASQEFYLH